MHCLCSFSAQAVISAILRSSESLQDHWGRDMLLGNRFPHSIYTERSVFHYLKALSLFLYPSPSQRRTHIHTLTRFDPCGMAYCSLYNHFRTQFELLIGFSSLIKKEQRMEQFAGFVINWICSISRKAAEVIHVIHIHAPSRLVSLCHLPAPLPLLLHAPCTRFGPTYRPIEWIIYFREGQHDCVLLFVYWDTA